MSLIDWAVARGTFPGELESGDGYLVRPFPGGVLVAAVDGLGHGADAARAARLAVATLEQRPSEPPASLLERCHECLAGTRGVVMSLARFDGADATITWVGVGNVEGVLLRAAPGRSPRHETLLLRGGVVGASLPAARPSVLPLDPGDTLLLATDGLRGSFADGASTEEAPSRLADRILAVHGRGTDDALILVARYTGRGR